MSVIRVLIADDSQEWREFISYLLAKDQRIEIVGEAWDGTQALELARQTKPTVILLDVRMPGLNGLDAARRLRLFEPNAGIIFVTSESDHDVVSAALEIGASGYVLKTSANRDLPIAIDAAIHGTMFVSDGLFPDRAEETNTAELDGEKGSPKAANASPIRFVSAHCWN